MILESEKFILNLSDDREYLADLIRRDKYCCMNDRGIARYMKFVKFLWEGQIKNHPIRGGVVYLCHIPGIGWTFDAYSEREKLKALDNRAQWAYKASCLVLDWFRRNIGGGLLAFVDEENRGAIFMAKKLGFKKQENKNGMVVLRKEF